MCVVGKGKGLGEKLFVGVRRGWQFVKANSSREWRVCDTSRVKKSGPAEGEIESALPSPAQFPPL